MRVYSRIYGTTNPTSPDLNISFDISEYMKDNKWYYGISNVSHEYKNELIDEINPDELVEKLKNFISALLNTENGPKWVQNPNIHIKYNDEIKDIQIEETKLLFK